MQVLVLLEAYSRKWKLGGVTFDGCVICRLTCCSLMDVAVIPLRKMRVGFNNLRACMLSGPAGIILCFEECLRLSLLTLTSHLSAHYLDF